MPLSDPNKRNLVAEVSIREPRVFNRGCSPRILAFDCGMKYNIIRYLARKGVELTVVPYDFDVDAAGGIGQWDGVFVSNGPGDPSMAGATIATLRKLIAPAFAPVSDRAAAAKVTPIFGICLGNQLLALATGASTFKMKYGNRGMNQ